MNNYPVKYIILSFNDTGYTAGINLTHESRGFIVARCYLISERKNYSGEGQTRNSYEVVIPTKLGVSSLDYPRFNEKQECVNSVVVDNIYDEVNNARIITSMLNDDLRKKIVYEIDFGNKNIKEKKLQKLYNKLLELEEYEEEMLHLSRNMVIDSQLIRKKK